MENLDALKPDSESEEALNSTNSAFELSMGKLSKITNLKSFLAAFRELGVLRGDSQEGEPGPGLNHQTVTNRDRPLPARPQRKRKNRRAMEHAPALPAVQDPGDDADFAGGRTAEEGGGESSSLSSSPCSPRPADPSLSVLGRFLCFSGIPAMKVSIVRLLLVLSIAFRASAIPLGNGSDAGPSLEIGDTSQALNATAATEQFQWETHLIIGVLSLVWWLIPQFVGRHEPFYGVALVPCTICYLALTFAGQGTLQQASSAGIALMVFIGLSLKHITADWADANRRSAVGFVFCAALIFAAYISSRISGDTTSTNCATLFRSTKCAGSFLFGTAFILPSLVLMTFTLWCLKLAGYYLRGTNGRAEPGIQLGERTQSNSPSGQGPTTVRP